MANTPQDLIAAQMALLQSSQAILMKSLQTAAGMAQLMQQQWQTVLRAPGQTGGDGQGADAIAASAAAGVQPLLQLGSDAQRELWDLWRQEADALQKLGSELVAAGMRLGNPGSMASAFMQRPQDGA